MNVISYCLSPAASSLVLAWQEQCTHEADMPRATSPAKSCFTREALTPMHAREPAHPDSEGEKGRILLAVSTLLYFFFCSKIHAAVEGTLVIIRAEPQISAFRRWWWCRHAEVDVGKKLAEEIFTGDAIGAEVTTKGADGKEDGEHNDVLQHDSCACRGLEGQQTMNMIDHAMGRSPCAL